MSRREIQRALYGGVKRKGPESSIQAACLDWLNTLPEALFFRRNVGAATFESEDGSATFVRFNEKGMSDIWGLLAGVHVEIEVKQHGKHPSAEQVAWLHLMRERGAIAFWCDSLDSLIVNMRSEYQQRQWLWRKSWEV
jgi:cold shock CspA family protein